MANLQKNPRDRASEDDAGQEGVPDNISEPAGRQA